MVFESNSDFCDVLVVDQEQIDLFLSNVHEEEANSLFDSPEITQQEPKVIQVDRLLELEKSRKWAFGA